MSSSPLPFANFSTIAGLSYYLLCNNLILLAWQVLRRHRFRSFWLRVANPSPLRAATTTAAKTEVVRRFCHIRQSHLPDSWRSVYYGNEEMV